MQDLHHTPSGSLRAPPQSQPFQSISSLGPSGSGQDFVLFEEPGSGSTDALASAPWAVSGPSTASDLLTSQQQSFNSSRPAFTDKPSFTEYRAPPGPGSLGGGAAGESPFSSPASRLEDDFAGPSSVGSHGSGTLSLETGIPNRKRQRGNDNRGHASSTSLSSLASAMATSRPMALSSSGTGYKPQRHSVHAETSASPSHSSRIPGLAQAAGGWGDDWSLADTSPRNPPSGSFGPPIGSLSLGGQGQGGDEELFPSLFPELNMSGAGAQAGDLQNFFNDDTSNADAADPMSSRDTAANAGAPGFTRQPRPTRTDPTPAQEELARRQVQQDLEGIDQRALRGPLRALVQGGNAQPGQPLQQPSSDLEPQISQAEMDSALQAAVQSFVAEADANRGLLASARAPGSGSTSQGGGSTPAGNSSALSQDQRNLLFPGSAPSPSPSPSQQSGEQQAMSGAQGGLLQRPAPLPRRRSNSFDSSYLPAERPWFSQSPPQTNPVNGNAGGGGGVQAAPPGGFGMGTGTGWTGFPTNNFNAFDLGGQKASQMVAQGKPQRRPLTRDRSGLTVSPQETFLNQQGINTAGMEWNGSLFATNPQEFIQAMNGVNGLQKATRDTLMAEGQPSTPKAEDASMKPQLLRGDTVRPSAQQQQAQTGTGQPPGGVSNAEAPLRPMQPGSSASSGMSIFSPGSSDTTPDTDEDERPFRIPHDSAPTPVDYDAILKQQQHQQQRGGTWPFAPRNTLPPGASAHQNLHVPRFLASSSSSSESDDDMSAGPAARGFPPFNAQQSGMPLDFRVGPLPPSSGPQQLGRGRGLQGGYGYMPGSAESGLQVDANQMSTAPRSRSNGAPMLDMSSVAGSSASGLESSGGQMSQEDERMSPSIRSMAQVVSPPHASMQDATANGAAGQPFRTKPGYGGLPVPDPTFGRGKLASAQHADPSQHARRDSVASTSSSGTGSQWESSEGDVADAAALDSGDDSDYQQSRPSSSGRGRRGTAAGRGGRGRRGGVSGRGGGPALARKRGGGAPAVRKKRTALDQSSEAETGGKAIFSNSASPFAASKPGSSEPALPPMYGGTGAGVSTGPSGGGSGGGAPNIGGLNTGAGGASQYGNLTICEYVSPLNGLRCGTEFHRPYDLARHRETIHAKEEASLMRQGKLSREQCRVLYVEVDPEKSQATQEWRCDGRNGCGSVFSRKDALQRHRRLRNH